MHSAIGPSLPGTTMHSQSSSHGLGLHGLSGLVGASVGGSTGALVGGSTGALVGGTTGESVSGSGTTGASVGSGQMHSAIGPSLPGTTMHSQSSSHGLGLHGLSGLVGASVGGST